MSAIVLADHDDPDFAVAAGGTSDVRLFPLGLPADEYRLIRSGGQWALHTSRCVLSERHVASASRVVVRRWRSSPPRPLVDVERSARRTDPVAQYVQRQWESTVLGLLFLAYTARPEGWSRSPFHVDNKIVTHHVLADLGVLPDCAIAQDLNDVPVWPATVAKPIDSDQSCGTDRRATTLLVSPADRRTRQPGPMMTQRAIISSREIRAVYSFGQIGAVVHTRDVDADSVDTRLALSGEIAPFASSRLTTVMEQISRRLALRVFTVDVKLDDDDCLWWLDVNPDGLVSPFDDVDGTLRHTLLAGLRN